ncbi:hypothetical protein ACMS87_004569 [Escherichia coli O35:H4]|nr:hypothetical protein [Escherichia coli]
MVSYSGIVFIWYPSGGNVGHASLQIGSVYSHENYVSWWPDSTAKPFRKESARQTWFYINDKFVKETHSTLPDDIRDEEGEAHVKYMVSKDYFNESAMLEEWFTIKNKPSAHYMLLSKNCSHIVARVLNAGFIRHENGFSRLSKSWNVTKPRDIASQLNTLASLGAVTKHVNNNCPKRIHRLGYVLLGMR